MDCSPPGSSVHGISQARILEWVAVPFSRGSSQPRDRTHVSCIGTWFFYCRAATRPLYKTKTPSLSDQLEVTPLRSFPTADLTWAFHQAVLFPEAQLHGVGDIYSFDNGLQIWKSYYQGQSSNCIRQQRTRNTQPSSYLCSNCLSNPNHVLFWGLTLPVYKIRSNKNFHLSEMRALRNIISLMREALCSLEEKYMTK